MNVPYNEQTKHIYETVARVAREIAAKEKRQEKKDGRAA